MKNLKRIQKVTNLAALTEILESNLFEERVKKEILLKIMINTPSNKKLELTWKFLENENIIKNCPEIKKALIDNIMSNGEKNDFCKLYVMNSDNEHYLNKLLMIYPESKEAEICIELAKHVNEKTRAIAIYHENKELSLEEVFKKLTIKNALGIEKILVSRDFDSNEIIREKLNTFCLEVPNEEKERRKIFSRIYLKMENPEDYFNFLYLMFDEIKLTEVTKIPGGTNYILQNKEKLLSVINRSPIGRTDIINFLLENNQIEALAFSDYLSKEEIEKLIENLNNKN
jgi:hypothetical protein